MKERELISLFNKIAKELHHSSLIKGIGDDAAVISLTSEDNLLVTADLMIEDIHFIRDITPPYALGYKALTISLSDIAAMGGCPDFFTLSVGFPCLEDSYFSEFSAGLKAASQKFRVDLIGGDTVKSEKIVVNTTVLGRVKAKKVLLRSCAQVGDIILVSGYVGDSAAGLALLKQGIKSPDLDPLIRAHLMPEPEVLLGQCLADLDGVHAAIDLSDGIATDLAWICTQSGVGARIFEERLPISELCVQAANFLGLNALNWALSGGEDYKLLFTVAPEAVSQIKEAVFRKLQRRLFEIGEITDGKGTMLVTTSGEQRDITFEGYEHFRAFESHLPV